MTPRKAGEAACPLSALLQRRQPLPNSVSPAPRSAPRLPVIPADSARGRGLCARWVTIPGATEKRGARPSRRVSCGVCVWSHHHLELSRSISENRRQFLKGALFPGAQQPGGVVFQAAWLGAPRDEACGDRQWGAACTEPTLPLCVGRAWVSGSKDLGPFAEGNRVRDAAGDPPALSPSSGHPRAQPTLGAARPMVGGGPLPGAFPDLGSG